MIIINNFRIAPLLRIPLDLLGVLLRIIGFVIKSRIFFEIRSLKLKFSFTFEDVIGRNLYLYGSWEPFQASLVKKTLKRGDLALDVGAHHGFYTLLMSKIVGPSGQIFAFEPSSKASAILNRHIEINEIQNVSIFRFGLGSRTSDSVAFVQDSNRNSGSAHISESDTNATEHVKLRTLDSLSQIDFEKVRVVKVDVEGFEDSFIEGAKHSISKMRKDAVIFLEVFCPNGKPLAEVIPSFTYISDDFKIYLLPTDYSSKLYFQRRVKISEIEFGETQIWGNTADLYLVKK